MMHGSGRVRGHETVRPTWGLSAIVAGLVVVLAPVAACGQPSQPSQPSQAGQSGLTGWPAGIPGSSGAGPGPTSSTAPSFSAGSRTSPTASAPAPLPLPLPLPGTAVRQRSVADQLAGFFAAATRADGQLRRAAAAVNRGIGTEKVLVDAEAVAAIEVIDTDAVVRAIPGGLPPALVRPALQVYADLVSREASFRRAREYAGRSLPRTGPEVKALMDCLGNGVAPARWFAGDLASVRALAVSTPAVVLAAPSSRRTGEVAIHAFGLKLGNTGCDVCGGYVPRPVVLRPIVWKPVVVGPDINWDGTVGDMLFAARYVAGQGWSVHYNAC